MQIFPNEIKKTVMDGVHFYTTLVEIRNPEDYDFYTMICGIMKTNYASIVKLQHVVETSSYILVVIATGLHTDEIFGLAAKDVLRLTKFSAEYMLKEEADEE